MADRIRESWTRLRTWMADYERPVGPPMPGVIPSTLAADRAVVEAHVMAEPAGDVAAAVEALSHYVEDGWSIAAPCHSTVEHRIHARAALALLAQAAQAGGERAEKAIHALRRFFTMTTPQDVAQWADKTRALLAEIDAGT